MMSRLYVSLRWDEGEAAAYKEQDILEAQYSVRMQQSRHCPLAVREGSQDGLTWAVISGQESSFAITDEYLLFLDGRPTSREGKPLENQLIFEVFQKKNFLEILAGWRGAFAGVFFDLRARKALAFRDHCGIRPLFFFVGKHADKHRLVFASHCSALLGVKGVSRRARKEFVSLCAGSHYRMIDNMRESSPFQDIAQLPAASVLVADRNSCKQEAYWDIREHEEPKASVEELAKEYQALLLQAVAKRLPQSGNAAFTLSGGMDSSSVLACAVQNTGKKQHAFSSVYTDKTFDESEEIASMLEANVSTWHRVSVDEPDVFSLVHNMVAVHGEPVATATWLAHFVLARQLAQGNFSVLFGGLGGDELNAGEYEHFFPFFADLRIAEEEKLLEHEISCWARHHDHPLYKKNARLAHDMLGRIADLKQAGICLPEYARLRKYAHTLAPDGQAWLEQFTPIMDNPFSSYLRNRTYQDLFRETTPCCLRAQDRHAWEFGCESENPFLDVDVVEFLFKIPGKLKIRDGVTKYLLREAMKGILPEETRTRVKKTGWNAPAHIWFSGKRGDELLDLIHSRAFCERGIYSAHAVEKLFFEHREIIASQAVKENHMMFFWQLLNLELWFREFQVEYSSV